MKKYLAVILILVMVIGGCASMGSRSGDQFDQKSLLAVEKTVEQNWWDIAKIGLGVGLNVLGRAILLNNYLPW